MTDKPPTHLCCDAFGCTETHPIDHDMLGEESFTLGRWLGWIYVDLNRPDLFDRPLRFCSVMCARWWFDREVVTHGQQTVSQLDRLLRREISVTGTVPVDEVAERSALKALRDPA